MTFESKNHERLHNVKDQIVDTASCSSGDLSRQLWEDVKSTSRQAGNLVNTAASDYLDLSVDIYKDTAKLTGDLIDGGAKLGRAVYQETKDVVNFAEKIVSEIVDKALPVSFDFHVNGPLDTGLDITIDRNRGGQQCGGEQPKESDNVRALEKQHHKKVHSATPVDSEFSQSTWTEPAYLPQERQPAGGVRPDRDYRRDIYYANEVGPSSESTYESMMQQMQVLMQLMTQILQALKGGGTPADSHVESGKHAGNEKHENKGGDVLGEIGKFIGELVPVAATVAEIAFPILTPVIEAAEHIVTPILEGEEG